MSQALLKHWTGAPLGRRRLQVRSSRLVLGCLALGGLAVPSELRAESLWASRSPQFVSYTADTKARAVGDIITIVITESTAINNSENTQLSKNANSSGALDLETSTEGGLGLHGAAGTFDLTSSAGRGYQGGASYKDTRAFTDRVSVTVVDVLPNGNLVVSGDRMIDFGRDQRTLHVSGVIRPLDISPDNSVSSRFVAEFSASYVGEGDQRRFTRQGWFSRAVNRAWPF